VCEDGHKDGCGEGSKEAGMREAVAWTAI